MPRAEKPSNIMSSSTTVVVADVAPVIRMPLSPWVVMPVTLRLRQRLTLAAVLSETMLMPLVPETRTDAKTSWQSMVSDLVMVTPPKPAGSRQLISPPGAVLEIAPAKVLQGAVRLHGLTSSPTPETQVRVAWALAGAAPKNGTNNPMTRTKRGMRRI